MAKFKMVLCLLIVGYLYVYVGECLAGHENSIWEAMHMVAADKTPRRFPESLQMAAYNGVNTDGAAVLQFLNARLKANDRMGGIAVADHTIVLYGDRDDAADWWIFFQDGKLLLCAAARGEWPTAKNGCVIARLEGFETVMHPDGRIINTITYRRDGRRYSQSGVVYLRSV